MKNRNSLQDIFNNFQNNEGINGAGDRRNGDLPLCPPDAGPGGKMDYGLITGYLKATKHLNSPAVQIFKSLDVVLPQIAAGLDLDDLKGNGAGIFQPVFFPKRDIGGLIFR